MLFLVTAAIFFNKIEIPTSVPFKISQGTFIPSLALIGQVVSGENSFEKWVNDDGRRTPSDGNISHGL